MYELLIVDDEIHIARGIKASVDWNLFGITAVHVAHNIRQVKEVFLQHPIDIIFCDIEMPEGNGFEVLSWVKGNYPSIQTIFLTCHADFSYAQKAIQLGSLDYLLKPVLKDQMETVLVKAIEVIEKERQSTKFNHIYKHYYDLWSLHQPLLIERFWLDLFNQRIYSGVDQIREHIQSLNLSFKDTTQYLPILLSVQRWDKELTVREEQIMEYALRKAAEETLFINSRQGQIISVSRGLLMVIISIEAITTDVSSMKAECEAYIGLINQYLYCQLSCYIGVPVYIQNMKRSYERLNLLNIQNVSAYNRVYVLNTDQEEENKQLTVQTPDMSMWSELLLRGEKEKALEGMMRDIEAWKGMDGLNRSVLQVFFQDFLHMIHHLLKQKGMQAQQIMAGMISPEQTISAIRSVIDLQDWVGRIVNEAMVQIHLLETKQSLADKVKNYIHLHINQDFSRQEMADYLELSPDYIVKLFKKETGISIADFIVQERVNNAKNLLVKTEIPICDIALLVGYSNFSYFSKVFKKATDSNPLDFRKRYKMQSHIS
jgi:two-component system response regulator YesN